MALVCPFLAPVVATMTSSSYSSFGGGGLWAKWMLVLAAVLYVGWVAANLYPHPHTLLPMSVLAGLAQCIAWAALISYMRALVHHQKADGAVPADVADHQPLSPTNRKSSFSSLAMIENDCDGRRHSSTAARQSGGNNRKRRRRRCVTPSAMVFVVCFQTSHVFGNLLSSLMLSTGSIGGSGSIRSAAGGVQSSASSSSSATTTYELGAGNKMLSMTGKDLGLAASAGADQRDVSLGARETVAGGYCGVYDSCELFGMSDVWNPSNPGEFTGECTGDSSLLSI